MFKRLNTSNQLILLVMVSSLLLVAVGTVGLFSAYRSNAALKSLYSDRTLPLYQLGEMQRLLQRSWVLLALATSVKSPAFDEQARAEIDASLESAHQYLQAYLRPDLAPQEVAVAREFEKNLGRMESTGFQPAIAALRLHNYAEAIRLQVEVMAPLTTDYRNSLHAMTKFQLDESSKEHLAGIQRFETYWKASVLSMVAGLIFAIVLGAFLVRSIVRSQREFEQSLQSKRELERQLQQSQKVQALGQLTGGIAHDFNNILAAVLGYAHLALSKHATDKDSKLAKYLREIIVASERARDLVAKMLTFTRTQPSENVALFSPAQVVQEVQSMMRHSIPSSIELNSRIEDHSQITADAGELNQMLVNLIINARDAIVSNGSGLGRIDILVHRVKVSHQINLVTQRRFSGTFLAIDVRDTGTGIAPEILPRVFDPFFTTKDIGKGTGLGLSMVQGIMTRAGGYILLQSAPGEGACFQLLFPLSESQTHEAAQAAAEPVVAAGSGELIWIVDDEAALTGYMQDLLNDRGYRTRVFNDPQRALAEFLRDRPPLNALITDMTMPGLSGPDLVKALHQCDPDIPVIFCTGFMDGERRLELPPSVQSRFLMKPVTNTDLIATIRELSRT